MLLVEVIRKFTPLMQAHFNAPIGLWIGKNWRKIESQTLDLARALKAKTSVFTDEILTTSTVVDIGDNLEDFIKFCEIFMKGKITYALFADGLS
jgi:hypothetical protein